MSNLNTLKLLSLVALAMCQMSCGTLLAGRGKSQTKSISINSNPQGATVIFDGQIMGITPLTTTILADNRKINWKLRPDLFNHQIEIMKEGYGTQTFKLEPDKITAAKKNAGFIMAASEITAACIMVYSKNELVRKGGVLIGLGGIFDLYNPRDILVATYQNDLTIRLLTNEQVRIKEEQKQKEMQENRLISQENQRLRIEQVQNNIKTLRNKSANAQWTAGTRICLMDFDCLLSADLAVNGNDGHCFKVSAFVENQNADGSLYQIRVEAISTGSVVHYGNDGVQFGEFNGVRYRLGELKWITPIENEQWGWIACVPTK